MNKKLNWWHIIRCLLGIHNYRDTGKVVYDIEGRVEVKTYYCACCGKINNKTVKR